MVKFIQELVMAPLEYGGAQQPPPFLKINHANASALHLERNVGNPFLGVPVNLLILMQKSY